MMGRLGAGPPRPGARPSPAPGRPGVSARLARALPSVAMSGFDPWTSEWAAESGSAGLGGEGGPMPSGAPGAAAVSPGVAGAGWASVPVVCIGVGVTLVTGAVLALTLLVALFGL
jgi:hypothetical protein